MTERSRKRSTAKWSGLSVCGAILVLWILSAMLWVQVRGHSVSGPFEDGTYAITIWAVRLDSGATEGSYYRYPCRDREIAQEHANRFSPDDGWLDIKYRPFWWEDVDWWPMLLGWRLPAIESVSHPPDETTFDLTLPFWALLTFVGIPALLSVRNDRRLRRIGHCRHCGYDLTGNISGICSECGKRIEGP